MSDVYRANRKATDADILRLNSVGLSLATIARALGCHPTTITLRLKSLKVPPADTRRSFMEDIFMALSLEQQEWFADQITSDNTLRDYVQKLIIDEYERTHP
jgi:AcrR family transcriptional regulator